MRENFFGVCKRVGELVLHRIGSDVGRRRAFESELAKLIAPHLPALVDRRMKLLDHNGRERWSDELDNFMRRSLWPELGSDCEYADRHRTFVALVLDVAIEREQNRMPVPCSI